VETSVVSAGTSREQESQGQVSAINGRPVASGILGRTDSSDHTWMQKAAGTNSGKRQVLLVLY
jgi:hypothetical protein